MNSKKKKIKIHCWSLIIANGCVFYHVFILILISWNHYLNFKLLIIFILNNMYDVWCCWFRLSITQHIHEARNEYLSLTNLLLRRLHCFLALSFLLMCPFTFVVNCNCCLMNGMGLMSTLYAHSTLYL